MSASARSTAFDAIVLATADEGRSTDRAVAALRSAGARDVVVVDPRVGPFTLAGDGVLLVTSADTVAAASVSAMLVSRVAATGAAAVPLLDVESVGSGLGVRRDTDGWQWARSAGDATDAVAPLVVVPGSVRARLGGVGPAGTANQAVAGIVGALADDEVVIDVVSPRHLLVDVVGAVEGGSADRTAAAIDDRLLAFDEERARMRNSVKEWDGWFTTHLVSPYTQHIARLLGRTRVTPTAVTIASIATSMAAAALVVGGGRAAWIVAAVLVQWSFALDCVDGQLARFALRSSVGGAWLDVAADRVKETALLGAIGIAGGGDAVTVAAVVIALQAVRHAANSQHPPALRPLALRGRWSGAMAMADAGRDRDGTGLGLWARRLAVYSIGERLAVISVGLLAGSVWFVLVIAVVWNVVALVAQWHGRRRPAGRAAVRRLPAAALVEAPIAAVVRVTAPAPAVAAALLAVGGAALVVASRSGTTPTAIAAAGWLVIATWAHRDTSARAPVAWLRAVDHAVVIGVLAEVTAWPVVVLIGVVATAHADVPYSRDFGARLGSPPRWPADVPELRPAVVASLAAAGAGRGGAAVVAGLVAAALVARWLLVIAVARRRPAAPLG